MFDFKRFALRQRSAIGPRYLPFAPVGTARHAVKLVNRTPALTVGLADEDVYVREQPEIAKAGRVQSGTVFYRRTRTGT